MNKPTNESLLKAHIELEKEKELYPEFIKLIKHKQENIRKILEWKGVIIGLLLAIWLIVYVWYNPPTELVMNSITPSIK